MQQSLTCTNRLDEGSNPAGGGVVGKGIIIRWQNGPLGDADNRQEPNGAFVEGVIEAARQRINWYQQGRFNCPENHAALGCLMEALAHLKSRTERREEDGTEGTHEGS